MSDLISRKAAIDALCKACGKKCDKRTFRYDCPPYDSIIPCPEHYALTVLPSAQPVARGMNVLSNDLIIRQAAIDALGERPIIWSNDDEYALGERNQYDIDRLAIETVPSAHSGRNHGHWVHRGCGVFECDQCGELVSTNVYTVEKASDRFKFCPNCGADMREGEQDD